MSLICLFLGNGRKGNGGLQTSFLLHCLYAADDNSQIQMLLYPRYWSLIFDHSTCTSGLFRKLYSLIICCYLFKSLTWIKVRKHAQIYIQVELSEVPLRCVLDHRFLILLQPSVGNQNACNSQRSALKMSLLSEAVFKNRLTYNKNNNDTGDH